MIRSTFADQTADLRHVQSLTPGVSLGHARALDTCDSGDQLEIVGWHAKPRRVNAVFFIISAIAVLFGCALVFTSETGPLAIPSLLVLTVATALWVANNAMRMSAVVDRGPVADYVRTRRAV